MLRQCYEGLMSERLSSIGQWFDTHPPDAPVTRASLPLISLSIGTDIVEADDESGDREALMLSNLSLALLIMLLLRDRID